MPPNKIVMIAIIKSPAKLSRSHVSLIPKPIIAPTASPTKSNPLRKAVYLFVRFSGSCKIIPFSIIASFSWCLVCTLLYTIIEITKIGNPIVQIIATMGINKPDILLLFKLIILVTYKTTGVDFRLQKTDTKKEYFLK